ncbi:helix-turn-helix transcriptional regulator [Umezawaea sp. Da 62-37]|uniref:helix-turn-helix domain-containing protein n=1 Tax=Umezawaea sp. Da 62-37 TaxID=3075927 RepID=UPI0028F6C5B9|nr:helix-turn-helix transcriptional regulator [Umezawaea sp. Da 62-37]WNV81923.1 helix-turn-helix transcriptional regulator [Umezawaea sp. Da 62-37]
MKLFESLSKREHEVLAVVAEDKTDREIATALGIRERTVRAHVSRIILKLGVASRVGAAVALVEWKLRAEFDSRGGGAAGWSAVVAGTPMDSDR